MTLQISNFHMTISGSRFLVPCPQGHVPHMGMLPVSDHVAIWSTTLGSRSPDFQNASGMFQTQMCDSQLPHLGLGTHSFIRGRIQGPRVNPRLSFLQIKLCFNISMNLMFSLHFAFQNISNMVRDNHGAGEPLPFVLLDQPKQRPQDSLILVFQFQQNVNKFRSLQGGSSCLSIPCSRMRQFLCRSLSTGILVDSFSSTSKG